MKIAILLILILIFSQIAEAQKTVACDIEASINNTNPAMTTDPTGTNVRSGPGTKFAIVRTLRDKTGFTFHITASQGNWVKIDEYFAWQEQDTDGRKPLSGWIYAPSLFVASTESGGDDSKYVANLYAAPDWKSKLLFPKHEKVRDVLVLQGCQGKWAKVAYRGKIGWLNPYSHCPELWDQGSCNQGLDN